MRLVLLTLLLTPLTAYADPGTIAAVATWVAQNWVIVAQVTIAVGSAVYGAQQQRRALQAQKDAYNSKLQDRTLTRVATEAPYRYVYGRTRVGSDIIAIFTSGDKDQYKYLVCVHAAHECDAIEEVYIAGKALGTLDSSGAPTSGDYVRTDRQHVTEYKSGATFTLANTPLDSSVTGVGTLQILKTDTSWDNGGGVGLPYTLSGRNVTLSQDYGPVSVTYLTDVTTPRVWVSKHLGTASDPADPLLRADLPSKWPSTAVVRGFCYTVVKLDLNQPEFQTGLPTVEVLLRGKKLYDFRTGTTAWGQNVVLAAYDYLTSELCGVPSSALPMSQWIAAANVCDEAVTGLGAKYTINGVVTSDEQQTAVLEKMAQAMAGGLVSTTWDIWAGKYVAPVASLVQTDIVGQLSIVPGASDADLYNGVKGQYMGSDNGYVVTDFTPYKNATYAANDGKEKWTNIDFPFTDETQRVHNLSRIYMEDQRNGFTFKAQLSLKAWPIRVGQRVTFTSAFFGWSNKVFRVIDRKYSPSAPIELTLKADDPSIWDLADATTTSATANTLLPNPYYVAPLANVTCTSGNSALLLQADGTVTSRILTTWPLSTTQGVVNSGMVEVEWVRADLSDQVWSKTQVSGDSLKAYLSPVEDNYTYLIRARAVNPYFNVKSVWRYVTHRVVGKTAPPPNVASFTYATKADKTRQFTWSIANQPVDVKAGGGYRIRYRTNDSGVAWSSMTALHDGLLTQTPYETNNPTVAQGSTANLDFAIVAVDSSGNESLTPLFITNASVSSEPTSQVYRADIQAGAVSATELADNAASQMVAASNNAYQSFALIDPGAPFGSILASNDLLNATITVSETRPSSGVGNPVAVDAYLSLNIDPETTNGAYVYVSIIRGSGASFATRTAIGASAVFKTASQFDGTMTITSDPFAVPVTLSVVDATPPVGDCRYYLNLVHWSQSFGNMSQHGTCQTSQHTLKLREIKR